MSSGDIKTSLNEKKELIVLSYAKTFDKKMSYIKACLTPEEIKELDLDEDFQSRLLLFKVDQRENIIQNLKQFMNSDDEKTAYKATMDLAKVLYPDFFEATKADNSITVVIEK